MDTEQSGASHEDPEAAFELGRRMLGTDSFEERRGAEPCFELAVQGGGPDMLWRVVAEYAAEAESWAGPWLRRAVATMGDPGGIVVDPGTLAIIAENDYSPHQHWSICVRSDDPAKAVAALTAALPRLQCCAADGRELSSEETDAALENDDDFYSPNYSDVDATDPAVPRVWLDCKGAIFPLMARSVIRVVIEELRAAGLSQATLFTPETTLGGPDC